ncbi:hypothetical protein [uncultured Brevibacillus sp.]|uniref:hypothetical protein n=1 Tax=uncultured Brevibacillus sp. TaxID=169970 RepID=UPI002592925C|nr:hypothetical protein [uncultured Brevibacillus sp.]
MRKNAQISGWNETLGAMQWFVYLLVTLLLGLSIMFLPSDMFQGLPTVVQYIAGNGLLVGVLIAMVLEKLWKEQKHFVA